MAAVRRAFISAFSSISTESAELSLRTFSPANNSQRRYAGLAGEIHRPSGIACVQCRFATISSSEMHFRTSSMAALFRRPFSSVASPIAKSSSGLGAGSFFNLMQRYEDIIGLTEVKEAQRSVLQVSVLFLLFWGSWRSSTSPKPGPFLPLFPRGRVLLMRPVFAIDVGSPGSDI